MQRMLKLVLIGAVWLIGGAGHGAPPEDQSLPAPPPQELQESGGNRMPVMRPSGDSTIVWMKPPAEYLSPSGRAALGEPKVQFVSRAGE